MIIGLPIEKDDHVPFTQGREGVKVQVFMSYISVSYLG